MNSNRGLAADTMPPSFPPFCKQQPAQNIQTLPPGRESKQSPLPWIPPPPDKLCLHVGVSSPPPPPSPGPQIPHPHPGPHPQLCQHTAIQAWKRLSRPQRINQKFKAATYHNDSFFTYDENQRGAEIPSILSEVSPARTGYAARVRAADL